EQLLRNNAQDEHDRLPKPGDISNVFAALDGLENRTSHALGRRHQKQPLAAKSHGRIHKARLDGQHMHARPKKTVSEPLKVDGQATLGGAIEVVALPPAVTGYGGYRTNEARTSRFKVMGDDVQG